MKSFAGTPRVTPFRMLRGVLGEVCKIWRQLQPVKMLVAVTVAVSVFTMYSVLTVDNLSRKHMFADASHAKPVPQANRASRKLLIEMVKSKGLWSDSATRRPVIQSLRERLQRASLHALNRTKLLEKQQEAERRQERPYEYWNIGGENLRFTWNSTGEEGQQKWVSVLKDISQRNSNVNGDKPWVEGTNSAGAVAASSENHNISTAVVEFSSNITYPLRHDDMLYFVKTTERFERRAKASFESWGRLAHRLIVSSDHVLLQSDIPTWKQRIIHLNQIGRRMFRSAVEMSCVTTLLNLAKVLQEEEQYDVKWVVFVDDDTFVVPPSVRDYLTLFDPEQVHYLALSAAEPVAWLPRQEDEQPVRVAASSTGLAYSRGLLQQLRHKLIDNLQLTRIHERCVRAHMLDYVALGLLATENNARLIARPDVLASGRSLPARAAPLTVHLRLESRPKDIARFTDLAAKYINATAMSADFGHDVLKKFI